MAAGHLEFDDAGREGDRQPLARPSFGGALRASAIDFYYHSIRFVPANFLWGLVLIGILMLAVVGGLWLSILFAPLLAVPLVGVYRLAGHAARGEDIVLSDALRAMRQRLVPAIAIGFVLSWGTLLLTINLLTGFASESPLGWALGTASFWGLVAAFTVGVALWPILGDPARPAMPLREAIRLAVVVVLASPWRLLRLSIVVAVLAVVSTVAFAAIISVSVAFIAILSSRVVLPEADRLALRQAGGTETQPDR